MNAEEIRCILKGIIDGRSSRIGGEIVGSGRGLQDMAHRMKKIGRGRVIMDGAKMQ